MLVYEIIDNNESYLHFIKKSHNIYYMIDVVGLYEINKKDLLGLIKCNLHKSYILSKNKYKKLNKGWNNDQYGNK